MIENLMLKQKIYADNVIIAIVIASFLYMILFLRIVTIMAIIVYPMCALVFYGILKVRKGFNRKPMEVPLKVLIIIYGIGCILFSIFFLNLLFTQPNVGLDEMIYLIVFPVILVALAGIVKSLIITEYKLKFRVMNIIISIITFIFVIIALIMVENFFIFHVFSLFISLFLNIVSRAILYLSEYELNFRLKNIKFFFYIINEYTEFDIIRMIDLRKVTRNK